ncbi:winged helix-turn-helix transcriptional regulator [Shimia sediminis]|uniref:winged helix-turn-helix transcriptional regulator n=1 Tax=Shimia sediminis TaxID=2497945 RepID=UPI001F3F855D|nr:helix-turn-helix domain-containing protein [Shimia sediminis]
MTPPSFCATAYVLHLLSGRWKFQIMHWLLQKPCRFNELQRLLGDVSHRTLSRQLKQMTESGLVLRHDHQTVPPHVEYRLSQMGESLRPVLCAMHDWGTAQGIDGHAADGEGQASLT